MILSNPVESHKALLKNVFERLDDTKTGKLSIDQLPSLRTFVAENTSLNNESKIQDELFNCLDNDSMVTCGAFLNMIMSNLIDEQAALRSFIEMGPVRGASGEDVVDSFSARSALRVFGEENMSFSSTLPDDMWEKILDSVMTGVEFEVSLSIMTDMYQKLASILRCLQLLQPRV
eukprot:GHVL01013104.1.p1 GENE.GHVL01013104.1~~GHVL01013104.1.p1  ORF type:complete len:175 (+),score=32.73 GHVL01013104.1:382-906(+)